MVEFVGGAFQDSQVTNSTGSPRTGLPLEAMKMSDCLTLKKLDVTGKRKQELVFFPTVCSDWEKTCDNNWDSPVAPFSLKPKLNPSFYYSEQQQKTCE